MSIDFENLKKTNETFFEEFKDSFSQTLDSGWFILGNNLLNFEKKFAEYNNSTYCLGVASGLDAIFLSLKSLDLNDGDEIIVPSNTFIATIIAIVNSNLKPILVEPDLKTYNIDVNKIEEKITEKTKAIIPVHLYGKCCNMDSILNIAKKHNLSIIEDAAQAHGAKYKNKKAGSFGIGAFSFYPTKNLGALGDAGGIVTSEVVIYEKIKKMRNYGSSIKYNNEVFGINSRLDEIQAGFLEIKLKYLDKINEHKRNLAKIYMDTLKSDFIKPHLDNDYYDVYHIFNIRHEKRNNLRDYLLKNGIKTEIHYPIPPHEQKCFENVFENEHYPISEEIHNTTLSLPISYFHTKEDIYKVVDVLNKF
ncbi:MAG: DegT/DnrJ/EryC1/StrS family aminotransferase [Candidatus Sericytochromatia bacterium]